MSHSNELPAEFGTTMQAAAMVTKLTTRAERNHYFDKIPAHFQPMVMTLAVQMIAAHIVSIRGIENLQNRRIALARVPEDWLEDVKAHVVRLWKRAELQARAEATA